MRIACYGYVRKGGGSGNGARYLILNELIKRGHDIDFFTEEFSNSSEIKNSLTQGEFTFVPIRNKAFFRKWLKKYLPKRFHMQFDGTIGPLIQNLYRSRVNQQLLQKEILLQHETNKYDLLLFLGLYAPFSLQEIPVISWVQGPPQTEEEYLHNLKDQVLKFCGLFIYLKLIFFYKFFRNRSLASLKKSHIFICGSQWSKSRMIHYGIEATSIHALPYPIDLNFMKPHVEKNNTDLNNRIKTFLWLGRIDTRKRFDLFIEAYLLLLQERQDVQLKIAGSFRYKGYKSLIDSFPYPNHISYYPSIDRKEVPSLINSCDLLIQPSEGENFGTSVAEAFCCGVPAIIGPTNGTKDYLDPRSFVFEEYTPQALKNKILQTLDVLEAESNTLQAELRRIAESNFQVGEIVNKVEEIFADVLSE